MRADLVPASLLALSLITLPGCKSPEPVTGPVAPPTNTSIPRADLDLGHGWQEVSPPADAPAGALARQVRFVLQAERVGAGSVLVLEDPWWRVQVSVNGSDAGEVTGGIGPVSVPVGEHLKAGENLISVVVSPPPRSGPGAVPRLPTNGERLETTLGGGTLLRLRPSCRVDDLALLTEEDEVRVVVRVVGAPAGARVGALAVLDGETLQDLGVADVGGELTTLPAVRWEGQRWSPLSEDPGGLVHVVARIEGPDGVVLDRLSRRTGVRSMDAGEEGFSLDGRRFPLLADRIQEGVTPHLQLADVEAAGINALEAHGHLPSRAWLDEADELGLPVVVLPRCVGAVWRGEAGDRWAELDRWREELSRQDEALVWQAAGHPSVLLWACEGSPALARRLCEEIAASDPTDTPVAAVDLASRSISGVGAEFAVERGADDQAPAWIVEIGKIQGGHSIGGIAQHFVQASGGVYGGVALSAPPRDEDAKEWRDQWRDVADSLGVRAPSTGNRRAHSRVRVTGLDPGQPVWLEAAGLHPRGAVASSRGVAIIDLWHRGACTLRAGSETRELVLEPDRWKALKRESNQVQVSLSR